MGEIKFLQVKFTEAVKEKMFTEMASRKKRIGLRVFAKEIGTSSSTLSRIELGKKPDIDTFFKLCYWMKRSSNEFYNHG